MRLLYATGLRASELVALRYLDFSEGGVFVRQGKGPQDRYALIDPESLRLVGQGEPGQQLVFPITRMTLTTLSPARPAKPE